MADMADVADVTERTSGDARSGDHEDLPSARPDGSFHEPFRSQKDEKEKAH
jgi:hypothetical protein